ncbi:MAG: NADP-dependent isocitrate dehydrogenase [Opitutales bacterium]|nr:NADP-dependent isocitrate dehydrogenase [Opitutales bacterium]MCH8540373.1 NADP-dependent isocitrate dehydrogenase [Opitutales bacterium]
MTTSPSKQNAPTITIARGDGIGPEIMEAVLSILAAAKADFTTDEVQIGEAVFKAGYSSGISPEAWDSIRKNKIMLKSPITTPLGGGYKSLNVTLRKTLGLYANLRPCQAFHPFVPSGHPGIDVLIVRENEEDTYAGIEHRQTQEVTQCLKLISRPGCEKIIRFAFETARRYQRNKVTCMTKNNIMKITDGLFFNVFEEIAREYPEFETQHQIIDIGSARMATRPEYYDVVVTPNLYGDILSDIAAEVAGSVGLAGSVNMGTEFAMFEAIHGSAPDIAGQNIANPSALLRAAVMMLTHLGQTEAANRIENAWLSTLEARIHTADMISPSTRQKVGTKEFAAAVIERLGEKPKTLPVANFTAAQAKDQQSSAPSGKPIQKSTKELKGVDVFIDWSEGKRDPEVLGRDLEKASIKPFTLKMVTNRGVKVYPGGMPETFCTDHWRCRFVLANKGNPKPEDLLTLQNALLQQGFDIVKTENLYNFDGQPGYSLGQGE